MRWMLRRMTGKKLIGTDGGLEGLDLHGGAGEWGSGGCPFAASFAIVFTCLVFHRLALFPPNHPSLLRFTFASVYYGFSLGHLVQLERGQAASFCSRCLPV